LVWWASRRLTRPLIELAEAADAVSAGDYRRRVDVEGEDEVGRLANAFNGMSEQVARSEAALSARLEEARRLAARLAEARRAADQARQEAEVANQAKADVLA
ncbi:MAG: HAMP domain-containing protein, partial [Gammaproteobacteria bacterium]|nr:cell wall metabolism sensor histidine kinase WalK [Gemmatimonadota bacterium]NIU80377.1 HAMP domain-containing protein [Gammaproteobacteria bacterium]NIW77837.1 HAMP domain-containing protein [Gemmatimonadota bacterium]